MRRKSPFWLIALILLGLAALVPLMRAQSAKRSAAQEARNASVQTAPTATAPSIPQNLDIKRLILADGSFQPIAKYEVKGDRVRYLSSDRFEWEEVPASLVDWAATEKYAREHVAAAISHGAREADAEEQAERKREAELTPEVASGLRLPLQGGVFLVDVYNQQAQMSELVQNSGEVKRNTGRNVLRATINPLASARQSIELKGVHARVQAHVDNPFLYVNLDEDTEPAASSKPQDIDIKDRFRIVRVASDPKKNSRVVGNIKVAIYGKVSQEQKFVPVTAQRFSGPWLKLTPAEPLAPGEYALVEMLADNQVNLYVWDFGVNPKAPANPDAWRAAPGNNASAASDSPVLGTGKKN